LIVGTRRYMSDFTYVNSFSMLVKVYSRGFVQGGNNSHC
jgi:hypothetical protein